MLPDSFVTYVPDYSLLPQGVTLAESTDPARALHPRRIETSRWVLEESGRGHLTVRLKSFLHFGALLRALDILPGTFVWRGQARPEWTLESSLERLRKESGFQVSEELTAAHLRRFQRSVRGRLHGTPPSHESIGEWWALGQHYGLATPLLDWTSSPWVAAYFAYQSSQLSVVSSRCIFGLSRPWCEGVSARLVAEHTDPTRPPAIDFVDPYTHDNARLIAQEGVFTRAPDGVAIEEWVRTHTEPGERFVHLLRIETPDADRKAALSQLAEMRITHSNLFPDAAGAAFDANYWYESEGELPDFLHRESLHPTESASRHNADAPTGASVDAARSTLRTDRPLQARGKPLTAKNTYTPRDRDGKILSDVDWTVTVERVGPLANPFFADATSSDPTS